MEGNVASASTQEEVKAPQIPPDGNSNATGVSVVSPQKHPFRGEVPADVLGALNVAQGSTASSRSSRRRLQLEAEIAEDESRAKIERKEQELELRRKQRKMVMEMELEARKEAMELAELKREEKLSLKLKKIEIMDQASLRGSGSTISGSFRSQNVKTSTWVNSPKNIFGPQAETKVEDEPQAACNSERPCSSRQADAKLQQSLMQNAPSTTTNVKPKRELKFASTVFVPSNISVGVAKAAAPNHVLGSTMQPTPTPTALPSVSVPMKLPKMVLDKFSGDPLEWPEWSGQFLATVDQAGVADSVKMKYLKTLVWMCQCAHPIWI